MPGLRKSFTVQHRSSVWRQASEGPGYLDRTTNSGAPNSGIGVGLSEDAQSPQESIRLVGEHRVRTVL